MRAVKNTLRLIHRVQLLTQLHYIEGVTTYAGIYRKYVNLIYPMTYHTYMKYMNTVIPSDIKEEYEQQQKQNHEQRER